MRVEVRPALAMEEMFADVVELADAGRMTQRGLPRNVLDLAVLARTYDREAHAPLLGRALQRVLLAPLVALARLRRRDGAERAGFEPANELAARYSLSRRVPSASRPPLRGTASSV